MTFDVKCPECAKTVLLSFDGITGVKCPRCGKQWYFTTQRGYLAYTDCLIPGADTTTWHQAPIMEMPVLTQ